jgi:hypothetical protein
VRRVGGNLVLTEQNIEAELSYAYLHAVASWAGFSCEWRNRHLDAACIDATVTEDGRRLAENSRLTHVTLDVQLKATFRDLTENEAHISYALDISTYDRLRTKTIAAPRLLVVLRLPAERNEWLSVTAQQLVARRCAYWRSLRGAPAVAGQASKTIHIPRANVLTPQALTDIMTRFSRQEVIPYEP